MRFAQRVDRSVIDVAKQSCTLLGVGNELWGESPLSKTLPDVAHGLMRGVEHVFGKEAIVTEFVKHNLVSREVVGKVKVGANLL